MYDVGEPVASDYYPDGTYWRFGAKLGKGKRIVITAAHVAEIDDVIETPEHVALWLRRYAEKQIDWGVETPENILEWLHAHPKK